MYWFLFLYFWIIDSDSDNFHTLKAVPKVKSNGSTKSAKTDADGPHQGVKVGMKSPAKSSSHQSKAAKSLVSPKATQPPQPKQTPTSVRDYFGDAAVQRSEKKLVASVKRKVVSADSPFILHWFHHQYNKKKSHLLFSQLKTEMIW